MRKRILALTFSTMVLSTVLVGCSNFEDVEEVYNKNSNSMFIEVEHTKYWNIVYDKETKVMYAVSTGVYNKGSFVLLVDESGDPKIWEDNIA